MRSLRFLVLTALLIAIASTSHAQGIVRCAACGQVILDDHLQVGSQYFHYEHFRCEYCKQAIPGTYVPAGGKFYHSECYQKQFVVVCVVCNKVILEDYREDFWGNPAHLSHDDDTPSCDFCERFIVGGLTAQSVELRDGRRLCGVCAATSVTTLAQARDLVAMVASSLGEHGIRVSVDGIPILLLGADRMGKLSTDFAHPLVGFTDYASTRAADDTTTIASYNIALLNGMPELQMASTIAHELMHVWLFRHGATRDDPPWTEGSCNYASYLILQDTSTRESAFLLNQLEVDTDSTYGEGFRRVKKYVDENGVDAWLEALASRRNGAAVGR
jgi:hypothetical protein